LAFGGNTKGHRGIRHEPTAKKNHDNAWKSFQKMSKAKCDLCKKRQGDVPICNENVKKELWICEQCDLDLFDARTLQEKVLREINIQISYHREERNYTAIRSLEHIKEFMLNI